MSSADEIIHVWAAGLTTPPTVVIKLLHNRGPGGILHVAHRDTKREGLSCVALV